MGVNICNSYIQDKEVGQFQPIMSTFTAITQKIQVRHQHSVLFQKIKNKFEVVDCRNNNDLKWYESSKFNLYLLGNVIKDRPYGQCFFYIKDTSIKNTPIIITTKVNQHYVYSLNTLIVYPENIIYFGSIRNNISSLPRAEGVGKLISKEFIYEGEFRNGYPHGFGNYRSKTLQYVGSFKNGDPFGQCIQKLSERLFIGTIWESGMREGFQITKNNQKISVQAKEDITQQNRLSLRSHIKQ